MTRTPPRHPFRRARRGPPPRWIATPPYVGVAADSTETDHALRREAAGTASSPARVYVLPSERARDGGRQRPRRSVARRPESECAARSERAHRTVPCGGGFIEFVCECSCPSWAERVALTLEDYELVRRFSTHFLVKPEHADATTEQVVAEGERFAVVEKLGSGADVAAHLDPRIRKTTTE